MYEDVIKGVPDYREFLLVDELNESSTALAEEHPEIVDLFELGFSRKGEPIKALRVGDGRLKAVLIGFPHPNEPIGSLTVEYLSRRLAEDDELRRELGFTWYFIKAADIDGARLNEGWFKGEYDNIRHMLNFYRTPGYRQVEWTFPVEYKTLRWSTPSPETRAVMNLIDSTKPDLVYSLHNSAFGGVYFYVSEPCPSLYPRLQGLAALEGLPLHLGEPEAPYMRRLDDAVFQLPPMSEIYDFYERHGTEDPASIINHGTSAMEYAKGVSGAFTIICELPYIYDEKIFDTRPTDMGRREAVLRGIELSMEVFKRVERSWRAVEGDLDSSSPFYEVVLEYLKRHERQMEAKRRWAERDPSLDRPATVSELFNNITITRYYSMRTIGQLIRLIDDSLRKCAKDGLRSERSFLMEELHRMNSDLERESRYRVIPLKKLVRVQVGAALEAMEYLRSRPSS
ncbi:MAG: M14 family zinc carboxypeptidase [Candidatus Bathyarchaeia archaeon]